MWLQHSVIQYFLVLEGSASTQESIPSSGRYTQYTLNTLQHKPTSPLPAVHLSSLATSLCNLKPLAQPPLPLGSTATAPKHHDKARQRLMHLCGVRNGLEWMEWIGMDGSGVPSSDSLNHAQA